jgi:hypothetical protein
MPMSAAATQVPGRRSPARIPFSWGDVGVVWRYLDYEFKSGEPAQSLTFNGVAAGVSFTF